jgi:general secretion pathway protein G
MIATCGILMILASAILPVARVARIRQKELELRRELRVMRTAIDRFKDDTKGVNGRAR